MAEKHTTHIAKIINHEDTEAQKNTGKKQN